MRLHWLYTALLIGAAAVTALPSALTEDSSLSIRHADPVNITDVDIFPRDSHELEKRQPPPPNRDLVYLGVYTIGTILFPEYIAVARLVGSVWSAVGRCLVNPFSFDCLFGAVDAVFNVWNSDFFNDNGINKIKRAENSPPIYGVRNSSHLPGPVTHTVSHIPISPHQRLIHAATSMGNNGTWAHIATTYGNGAPMHHLMYRRAHETDLGKPNDGRYHHFRAQPASAPAPAAKGRLMTRAEDDSNGVVVDYLWRDGNRALWNDIKSDHISNDQNWLGSTTANWMEQNSAEATCATVGVGIPVSEGSSPIEREDQGVIAYGWNNRPFNFAGRAGGWVDSCY